MKRFMPTFLKNFIKKQFKISKEYNLPEYSQISFSQYAEDIVLQSFLTKSKGFYVDIGAHHPHRFSNTFIFYLKGWNGINVDATPGSMKIFRDIRPRDINIEIGISNQKTNLLFYQFQEPAINTFSKELADIYISRGKQFVNINEIKTISLEELLDNYLPKNQKIDFLTIDIEGLDEVVLKSNNWNKYKPEFIILELWNDNIESIISTEIYKLLTSLNYRLVAKTLCSLFFKLNNS